MPYAPPMLAPALILASGSPRRKELLARMGLAFTVRPSDIDETPRPGEEPAALVERLAREKAAAARPGPGEVAIAADTEVAVDGTIFGKPKDDEDAARMLRLLAGREHDVLTGVAVLAGDEGRIASGVERTRVAVASMTEREIAWYVATGEPRDKAGAYGIHGFFAIFATAVTGNYANVVGLPQPLLYRLASEIGVDLLARE